MNTFTRIPSTPNELLVRGMRREDVFYELCVNICGQWWVICNTMCRMYLTRGRLPALGHPIPRKHGVSVRAPDALDE